jgi:cobalt-zinc-cadmium efflux system membrane fusion protein
MKMKKTIPCIPLFLLLLGCSGAKEQAAVEENSVATEDVHLTEVQMEKALISTGELGYRRMNAKVKVNGVVDVPPQNMVSVSFPMGGYLRYTKLMPGMRVTKGEVIAEMEDPGLVQLQQDYLVTRARLGVLEKEYERQRELNVEKVNSDKTFQQVGSEFASSRIMLRGYAEKLRLVGIDPERLTEARISRRVSVRSPINGYVSKVNVNIGRYVQPSDVLFELLNPDDIHAALSIFEKDLSRVAVGQKVGISFVDEPDKEYEGRIILLNRNVDEDRVAVAHCHFLSRPKQLLPGMFLTAGIRVSDEQVPVLPEASVVRSENKEYVFTETGQGRFRMREVSTGVRDGGMVEIVGGRDSLTGKRIVVHSAYSVLGAMKNTAEEE